MKFCSSCGSHLVEKIPRDDDRRRHVCPGCDTVHYQNPKIVTGCLPVWEDSVLLCRELKGQSPFFTHYFPFCELRQ